MKNKNTMFLVQAAAIGAIYVVLTLLFAMICGKRENCSPIF